MKTMRPESEAPVPTGWFGDLHDDIRSMIAVGDGKTVFVDHLPTGQVIRFRPQAEQRGGGVSGGGSSEYNGYFKVVETTDESGKAMLKIIDGAAPDSNVAGVSDLGSVGQLTIEKKNSSYLYIYPEWIKDSNPPRYTFKLSTSGNPYVDIEFLLATTDATGAITQRWTEGVIYWGSRFFV